MTPETTMKLREDKVYDFGSRDTHTNGSLYLRVADELIQEVADNPGPGPLLLPQERDLAARFKVSRSTIRQALAVLEQYDLVQRRRGHGTLLTKPADEVMQVWRLRNKHLLLFQFSPAQVRSTDYYGRILSGMISVAKSNRQGLQVKYCYYPGEVPRDLHALPDSQRIAGVLVCGMYDDKFLKLFSDHNIPCVCVDYWPHDEHTDAVTVDVEAEAFLVASHLVQMRYRSVGFAAFGRRKAAESVVCWDPDVWRFLAHLRRAAGHYGLLIRDEWIQTVPGADQFAQKSMDRFCMLDRLPEAMVCFDKDVASRVLEGLRRCGLRCPENVGVVTRGDGRLGKTNLTAVECRAEEIGRNAMQMMLDRIYRRRTYPIRAGVASRLVPGQSTRLLRPANT